MDKVDNVDKEDKTQTVRVMLPFEVVAQTRTAAAAADTSFDDLVNEALAAFLATPVPLTHSGSAKSGRKLNQRIKVSPVLWTRIKLYKTEHSLTLPDVIEWVLRSYLNAGDGSTNRRGS